MVERSGIICVEGADGVGKTTLADHFVSQYGAVKFHQTNRFRKMMNSYHKVVFRKAEKLAAEGKLVILDRLFCTECIYASVFRGATRWPEYTHELDQRFQETGVLSVLCLANDLDETLKKKRERDLVDPADVEREKGNTGKAYTDDQLTELHQRYWNLWNGNMFCEGEDVVAELTRTSGVRDRKDYARYRIEVEGQDVDSFAWNMLRRLERLRGGR